MELRRWLRLWQQQQQQQLKTRFQKLSFLSASFTGSTGSTFMDSSTTSFDSSTDMLVIYLYIYWILFIPFFVIRLFYYLDCLVYYVIETGIIYIVILK